MKKLEKFWFPKFYNRTRFMRASSSRSKYLANKQVRTTKHNRNKIKTCTYSTTWWGPWSKSRISTGRTKRLSAAQEIRWRWTIQSVVCTRISATHFFVALRHRCGRLSPVLSPRFPCFSVPSCLQTASWKTIVCQIKAPGQWPAPYISFSDNPTKKRSG